MDPNAATAGAAGLGTMGQLPSVTVRAKTTHVSPRVEGLEATAYEIPTEQPESDGTLEWDATTIVVVEAFNGRERGIGYTYGDRAVTTLIDSKLAEIVRGADAMRPPQVWAAMRRELRNAGQPGLGSMAISAVDIALWDLKARLLGLCLADLLGRFRKAAPVYGSGGFTSYSDARLAEQLEGWVERGIPRVKIKIGRDRSADPHRCAVVREAIGDDTELFVDANGAYARAEALEWCVRLWEEFGVSYVEEPVSSDDVAGLRHLRDRAPAGQAIAAGEYGWDLPGIARTLDAVHVQQVDVTRCGGITNFLRAGALCQARQVPLSAHCAPNLSAHVCCGVQTLAHIEYFHDHARIEDRLFDGTLAPDGGELRPDPSRPGHGMTPDGDAMARFAVDST
jgi:L-alanine-DL-glutamate epimerase-like enolase superfamily enzyme